MGIEVGGGQVLYSQYKGNVCLSVLVTGKFRISFYLMFCIYVVGII